MEKTENEVSCDVYGCSLSLVLSFSKFSFHFAYSLLTKLFLNNVIFTIAVLFTLLFDIFLVYMDVSFGAATLLLPTQGPICSNKFVMLLWQMINNFQLLLAVLPV